MLTHPGDSETCWPSGSPVLNRKLGAQFTQLQLSNIDSSPQLTSTLSQASKCFFWHIEIEVFLPTVRHPHLSMGIKTWCSNICSALSKTKKGLGRWAELLSSQMKWWGVHSIVFDSLQQVCSAQYPRNWSNSSPLPLGDRINNWSQARAEFWKDPATLEDLLSSDRWLLWLYSSRKPTRLPLAVERLTAPESTPRRPPKESSVGFMEQLMGTFKTRGCM